MSHFNLSSWHFRLGAHFFIHIFEFFKRNGLNALLLCLKVSSLVVVTQVARLTHSQRVVESWGVLAGPGQLSPTRFAVARSTHVLGVVFAIDVRTCGDEHHVLSFYVFDNFLLRIFVLCFFLRDFFERDLLYFSFTLGGSFSSKSFHWGGGLFFRFLIGGFFQNFIF